MIDEHYPGLALAEFHEILAPGKAAILFGPWHQTHRLLYFDVIGGNAIGNGLTGAQVVHQGVQFTE